MQEIEKKKNVSNNYKIQLASVKSEAQGLKEWERIKNKYSKILGKEAFVEFQKSGKKDFVFYLILAGNYPTINKAKNICKQLIKNQQSCVVYLK